MRRGVYIMMGLLLLLTAAIIVRWVGSWPLIIATLATFLALSFIFIGISGTRITHLTDFSLHMIIYSYLFLAVALPLIVFLFTRQEADIWGIFLSTIMGLFSIGVVILLSLVVTLVSLFGVDHKKVKSSIPFTTDDGIRVSGDEFVSILPRDGKSSSENSLVEESVSKKRVVKKKLAKKKLGKKLVSKKKVAKKK